MRYCFWNPIGARANRCYPNRGWKIKCDRLIFSTTPTAISLQCNASHQWPLSLQRYGKEVIHIVIKQCPQWLFQKGRANQRGVAAAAPQSCEHPPSHAELPACLRLQLNLPPPHPHPTHKHPHHAEIILLSSVPAHRESCEHRPQASAAGNALPVPSAISPVNAIRLCPAAQSLSLTFPISLSPLF